MEVLKITYDGEVYKDYNTVPYSPEDLKFSKKVANWGKPTKEKCQRAVKIQHCYAILIKKGLTMPDVPAERWPTQKQLEPLAYWLEIRDRYEASGYLEPLRIAKAIFIETRPYITR